MKVLMTGATGFVGKVLVKKILAQGDEVVVLSRNKEKAKAVFGEKCQYGEWKDTNTLPPLEVFNGVEGVINLMGEGIADKRWSPEQKNKIRTSRLQGTTKLIEAISKLSQKPKVMVSTSAIGIYGSRGDEELTENSKTVHDFLGSLCTDWEKAASSVKDLGVRLVIIRTGVVLGKDGGALKKMLPPFKLGLGGPLGDGKQYMSWIHIDDLASMYIDGLKNPNLEGPFNGTAPHPLTNKEFTKVLGKTLHRPTFLPAPAFAIKAAFGEMSTVILDGQKVMPEKFLKHQFKFKYPDLEKALSDIV